MKQEEFKKVFYPSSFFRETYTDLQDDLLKYALWESFAVQGENMSCWMRSKEDFPLYNLLGKNSSPLIDWTFRQVFGIKIIEYGVSFEKETFIRQAQETIYVKKTDPKTFSVFDFARLLRNAMAHGGFLKLNGDILIIDGSHKVSRSYKTTSSLNDLLSIWKSFSSCAFCIGEPASLIGFCLNKLGFLDVEKRKDFTRFKANIEGRLIDCAMPNTVAPIDKADDRNAYIPQARDAFGNDTIVVFAFDINRQSIESRECLSFSELMSFVIGKSSGGDFKSFYERTRK